VGPSLLFAGEGRVPTHSAVTLFRVMAPPKNKPQNVKCKTEKCKTKKNGYSDDKNSKAIVCPRK